jgi:hypothetical protein
MSASRVLQVCSALLAMGCYEVSLGDTIGAATPHTTAALLTTVTTRTYTRINLVPLPVPVGDAENKSGGGGGSGKGDKLIPINRLTNGLLINAKINLMIQHRFWECIH